MTQSPPISDSEKSTKSEAMDEDGPEEEENDEPEYEIEEILDCKRGQFTKVIITLVSATKDAS
jgi:hypothetical protein